MLGQWVSPLIGKIIRFGTNKIDYRYCYRRIYIPRGDYSFRAPTVFILFTTRCILNAQFVGLTGFYSVYRRICFPNGTSCHSFAFRQSSREFTLVRLYLNVKQVEDSENRYGVYLGFCLLPLTGLVGFCLKPTHIQGSYNSLSSVFRLLLIEAITLPFHRQKSKYSLSISLSPRSIFCNNRLLRNFLLSPSTLYGPTL